MKIIIGLGNPGEKYAGTRHNAGFMALDHFLNSVGTGTGGADAAISGEQKKFKSLVREGNFESGAPGKNIKALFAYPQTYMNNSGQATREILDFYKLSAQEILVLHDDVDLPLGNFKFTDDSGSAGHNGVQSIINILGAQQFARIRIGIETRADKNIPPTDAFVLQSFSEEEIKKLPFKEINKKIQTFLFG